MRPETSLKTGWSLYLKDLLQSNSISSVFNIIIPFFLEIPASCAVTSLIK